MFLLALFAFCFYFQILYAEVDTSLVPNLNGPRFFMLFPDSRVIPE